MFVNNTYQFRLKEWVNFRKGLETSKTPFNDILEVHANSTGTQSTAYLSDKHMLIELIGS